MNRRAHPAISSIDRLLLLLLLLVAAVPPAHADGAVVTIDGVLDDAAWDAAVPLEVEALAEGLQPEVRVLVAAGRLWLAVAAGEAPGPGMGFSALVVPEDAAGAADAVTLAYAPQDPRSPAFVARGPAGVGRSTLRLEAAADVQGGTHWSVEAGVPLVDLFPDARPKALRIALAVRGRQPGRLAWAPPAAAFAPPSAWARVEVGEAAWTTDASALPDGARLAADDARDAERLEAWRLYLAASRRSTELMLQARGFDGAADPRLDRTALRDAVARPLLEPLERMAALRPDLALVHVLQGDVRRLLGEEAAALEAYAAAQRVVPGLPEASFGAWVQTRGPALTRGAAGEATDYGAARRALAGLTPPTGDEIAADGVAYAGALLDLAEGGERLAVAGRTLARLEAKYGFDQLLASSAERARQTAQAWAEEGQHRRAEAERDDLPRVRLATTRGDIVLELFEDDAPNSVSQFVRHVRAGTYAGATVGATIPFLASLVALDRGTGGPIATERGAAGRARAAFRGVIGFLGTARDTEDASFFLTTGTATHLGDEYVVFGRILEGQEAADALRAGDVILQAEVLRTRPGTTYRPVGADGEPAPEAD